MDTIQHREFATPNVDEPRSEPEPNFAKVPTVRHKYRGPRPNGLQGAIVHFDAGRSRPTRGPDDPDWGARNCLVYGQQAGFAYATVSRAGTIFLPANMDWEQWGSHAGISRCPVTGRSGVSRFTVGFEVNSPGFVHATDDPDLFVPWFEAVRDTRGHVVLDRQGKARVKNPKGELYRKSDVRIVAAHQGNIRPGAYVPYTQAQMAALVDVMLWLKFRNPATFRLTHVFGHDEVAPTRKFDPGGALGAAGGPAMTMDRFRAHLMARAGGAASTL